jgi:integrase
MPANRSLENSKVARVSLKRRRIKGEGAIFERRPGLWAGVIELPRDPATGNRRRRWIYGKSEVEVADALRKIDRADGAKGRRTRVDVFLEGWLTDAVEPSMRPATAVSYRSVVDTHIIPAIGALYVERLTTREVLAFYADSRSQGMGPRTLQKVHAVLHRALSSAVTQQMLARNPAALGTDAPKYRAPTREALTREQARKLLAAAQGDRLSALYVLALVTGAREGELLALQWRDIDLWLATIILTTRIASARSVTQRIIDDLPILPLAFLVKNS